MGPKQVLETWLLGYEHSRHPILEMFYSFAFFELTSYEKRLAHFFVTTSAIVMTVRRSLSEGRQHEEQQEQLVIESIANLGLEIDRRIWVNWDDDQRISEIACKAHQSFANAVISQNINVAIEELSSPIVRANLFDEGLKKADIVIDRFLSKYCKEYRQYYGKGMEETKGQLLRRVKEKFRTTLKPHFDSAIFQLCDSLKDIGKVASQYVSEQNGGRPVQSIEFELPRTVKERVPSPEPEPEESQDEEEDEVDITSIPSTSQSEPSTSKKSRLPPLPIPLLDNFMNFHNEAVFNYFHDEKFGNKVDKNYRKQCRERKKNKKND